jgi:hypothetical protein
MTATYGFSPPVAGVVVAGAVVSVTVEVDGVFVELFPQPAASVASSATDKTIEPIFLKVFMILPSSFNLF